MFECAHQPLVLPAPVQAELAAAYREPHRAYHTLAHVEEVLRWFDRVAEDVGWRDPDDIYAAIVFHDAIYVPGAKDNEARSAAWAARAGFDERVQILIELTARHGALQPDDVDPEAALFLDCDMAILAAEPAAFDAYDHQIAIEYQHVPADAFRAGRKAFLAGVLAKPRIFLSDYFHEQLDARARENLRRATSA